MRFRDLIIKDIKTVVYDIKSLAIILIMPVVLMSILGASLQGVFGDESESGVAMTKIGVVKAYDMEEEMYKLEGKLDMASYDQETLDGMNTEKTFFSLMDDEGMKDFVDYELVTYDQGMQMLKDETVDAVVILPKDFIFDSYMRLAGSRLVSEIEYVVNPDNDFVAGIVQGIISAYVDMNNNFHAIQMAATGVVTEHISSEVPFSMSDMMRNLTDNIPEVSVETKSVHKDEVISSFQYYSAAIMCMFLLYSAGLGGRALLQEKKEQTIPRLTVSGTGLFKLALSNYFRVVLLVLMQSIIMIAYSSLVLNVDWGSMASVVTAMIFSALAVASIGMFVAIITLRAGNYKVANAFEFGLIYVMALLGGSFMPVETLPDAVGKLGFLSLNGQVLDIYINGMYNLPLAESINAVVGLIAFTVIFFVAAIILMQGKGSELA